MTTATPNPESLTPLDDDQVELELSARAKRWMKRRNSRTNRRSIRQDLMNEMTEINL